MKIRWTQWMLVGALCGLPIVVSAQTPEPGTTPATENLTVEPAPAPTPAEKPKPVEKPKPAPVASPKPVEKPKPAPALAPAPAPKPKPAEKPPAPPKVAEPPPKAMEPPVAPVAVPSPEAESPASPGAATPVACWLLAFAMLIVGFAAGFAARHFWSRRQLGGMSVRIGTWRGIP